MIRHRSRGICAISIRSPSTSVWLTDGLPARARSFSERIPVSASRRGGFSLRGQAKDKQKSLISGDMSMHKLGQAIVVGGSIRRFNHRAGAF
jgi:hypothetical protein